jgi:hypothetical protein
MDADARERIGGVVALLLDMYVFILNHLLYLKNRSIDSVIYIPRLTLQPGTFVLKIIYVFICSINCNYA